MTTAALKNLTSLIGIFCVLFSLNASAVFYEDVEFKPGMKIGLYRGSFDPIHVGHDKVIRDSIEAADLDYVIVMPGDDVSFVKPNRTPVAARIDMLRDTYKNDPKIVINHDSYGLAKLDKVIDHMNKKYGNMRFFALIGGDHMPDASEAKSALKAGPIESWIVSPRASGGEMSYIPEVYKGRPVIALPESEGSYSSTAVRKYLLNHPEFFDPKSPLPPESDLPLRRETMLAVRKHGQYFKEARLKPSKMSYVRCVLNAIPAIFWPAALQK